MNKNITPNDIAIYYTGGSGGFFVFYQLMLSGKYHCFFQNTNLNFKEILTQHWNIVNVSSWKNSEIWPDNKKTYESSLNNKIFLFCNANSSEYFDNFIGKKIVVYLDFDDQYEMCKAKRAHFYYNSSVLDKQNELFVQLYNNIKTNFWPTCNHISEFEFLPDQIKDECLSSAHFSALYNIDTFENEFKNMLSRNYNQKKLDKQLIDIIDLNKADLLVNLKDVIKSSGEVVYKYLKIDYNSHRRDCENFTNFYLNLHPEPLRNILLCKN